MIMIVISYYDGYVLDAPVQANDVLVYGSTNPLDVPFQGRNRGTPRTTLYSLVD